MSVDPRVPWLVDDLLRVEELLLETAGSSLHPLVSESSTHLIRAGGKRLRPSLVLVSSRAGEPGRRATDLAAAAVELIHLATLYHDDVIDETDTRRGAPTVHSKWGVEVAVLAGDYLFAHGSALGAEAGHDVPAILAKAVADVCEGQIVETAALSDPRRGTDHYLGTISGKTAALFRASCEMGATTSGADGEARAALAEYGHHLGIAFQIVDDLLDLIGDPAITGKIPGTDLKEGVFTLPVLIAVERAEELAAMLERGERDLASVLPVLEDTGALLEAREVAEEHGRSAAAASRRAGSGDWQLALETIVEGVLAQVPLLQR
ncbi:MAG: polyprenyl synthetase family protein [Actinobacteria bacterium]|nr:polyprenyl synthetase family protein [Actinomycetota bacterium]